MVAEALLNDKLRPNMSLARYFAATGSVNLLTWYKNAKGSFNATEKLASPLHQAVISGKLSSVKWMYKNGFAIADPFFVDIAASRGRIDIVKYLCGKVGATSDTVAIAVKSGNMGLVKWLRKNEKHSWMSADEDAELCNAAASVNNYEMLKWLIRKGCKMSAGVLISFAKCGNLAALQQLHSDGYCLVSGCCNLAARHDHLEILKWLHENGCKWNNITWVFAKVGGSSRILQYLRDNGCPGE